MPLTIAKFMLLLAPLVLLPGGCARNADQQLEIASYVWPGYEFLFIARDMLWLDSEKVFLRETDDASESLALLTAGKLDGAALTLDEVLRARAQGVDLRVVMIADVSSGADMVLARKPLTNGRNSIIGKRIGVESGTTGEILLAGFLKRYAVKFDEVTIVELDQEAFIDAWQNDKVDFQIAYEPRVQQLMGFGATPVFTSSDIPFQIIDVIALRATSLTKTHAIENLLRAHFHALNYFSIHSQDTLHRMARHMNLTPDGVRSSFRGLLLPDLSYNLQLLAGESPELLKHAEILAAQMGKLGYTKNTDILTDLVAAEPLLRLAE